MSPKTSPPTAQKTPPPTPLATIQDVSEFTGIAVHTLYQWSSTWSVRREGPRPIRLAGRRLRYQWDDVLRWVEESTAA